MEKRDCLTLSHYQVEKAPKTVYYIPNFISPHVEKYLLDHIYSAPKPKWTQLSRRRLQNWGGVPHPKGMITEPIPNWLQSCIDDVYKVGIFAQEKRPNHVLINEYESDQGIMPHTDGPLYHPIVATLSLQSSVLLDIYKPLEEENPPNESSEVTKVSPCSDMGDNNLEDVFKPRRLGSVLLEPRSLYIGTEDVYSNYLHGIREVSCFDLTNETILNEDCFERIDDCKTLQRTNRVSVTIRHVPKVLKNKLFMKLVN